MNVVNRKRFSIAFYSAAVCRRILKVPNAWIDGNGYLEGDKLSFRCRTDYVLDGERSITCTGNRRWSHTIPTCKGDVTIFFER